MTAERPKLSVVVASRNARASIEECLAALLGQRQVGVQIVVVDNSTDGTTEIIKERFPGIHLIATPPSALIPELWEAGIRQSTADIVAITTAHCVPRKDWISEVLRAHEGPAPAVGGAIENDESAGVVDWAVFFCRYSHFMPPLRKGFASEIPGDNASYKRVHLDRYQHVWRNGFWEPAVHAELKRAGLQLLLVPSIVVSHRRSFGLGGFLRQRFQHGLRFGAWRAAGLSRPQRALYLGVSWGIPLVLLARIVLRVLRKGRHRSKLFVSLPILVPFLLAWALGEAIGCLRGATA